MVSAFRASNSANGTISGHLAGCAASRSSQNSLAVEERLGELLRLLPILMEIGCLSSLRGRYSLFDFWLSRMLAVRLSSSCWWTAFISLYFFFRAISCLLDFDCFDCCLDYLAGLGDRVSRLLLECLEDFDFLRLPEWECSRLLLRFALAGDLVFRRLSRLREVEGFETASGCWNRTLRSKIDCSDSESSQLWSRRKVLDSSSILFIKELIYSLIHLIF